MQHHGPEAKRSSRHRLLGLYICLPLALLGLLVGVLLLIYFRYRRRRKTREAAVVFTTPGYDNTIYALPQPVDGVGRPSDAVSLPPPYEESPYETIADFSGKKSGLSDDGRQRFLFLCPLNCYTLVNQLTMFFRKYNDSYFTVIDLLCLSRIQFIYRTECSPCQFARWRQ